MRLAPLALALLLHVTTPSNADRTPRATANLVTALPGVSFATNFQQFAGYLNASGDYGPLELFYWHIESQGDPVNDPVILYINGGPGCSSLSGLMEEIGPFRATVPGTETLTENVFSWNKIANLLVIDPPNMSFSQAAPWSTSTDDNVVSSLEAALQDFFRVFPERISNRLYLAGEGYASVYVTRIAYLLLQRLAVGTTQANLQGIIIENGVLSAKTEFNTILPITYTHAYAGKDEWDDLRSSCCGNQSTLTCDFYGNPDPACKSKSQAAVSNWINQLVYKKDMNQDCYRAYHTLTGAAKRMGLEATVSYNLGSTDPWNGFPCTADSSTISFLDHRDTQAALHARNTFYITCLNLPYDTLTSDLTIDLSNVISHNLYKSRNMSILFYNGDLDSVNNFLSAQNFLRNFASVQKMDVVTEDTWKANYNRDVYKDMDGGLRTIYTNNIHVISVRGAGHYVPISRPAQALQVVRNFLNGFSYDNCLRMVNLGAAPLLPMYSYLNPSTSRRDADEIKNLPGLTFVPNFKQYSGYLNGSDKHRLHY